MPSDRSSALLSSVPAPGYRVLRNIAPPRSPWPGQRAVDRAGSGVMLVAVQDYPGPLEGGEHVAAPLDIVRRPDGHDLVLPACLWRADELLARSTADRLTAGEAVTLAVSLLRGLDELGGRADGHWWFTDDARPVFVVGDGIDAAEEASSLLRTASASLDGELVGCLDALALDVLDARAWRRLDRAATEDSLLRAAEPQPIRVDERMRGPLDLPGRVSPRETTPWAADPVQAVSGVVPWSQLRNRASRLVRWVRDRAARVIDRGAARGAQSSEEPGDAVRPTRRKGPFITAGVIAAVALVILLVWPSAPAEPEGAAPAAHAAPQRPSDSTSERPALSPDPDGDLSAVVRGLLSRRVACGGDEQCLSGVVADGGRVFAAGVIDRPQTELEFTLVDEFGGVAVVRVDSREGHDRSQLVVVARGKDGWLLRDVHEVAEQPSSAA